MINKYVWNLYLKSEGEKTVKLFEDFFSLEPAEDFGSRIKELLGAFSPSERANEMMRLQLEEAVKDYISGSDDSVNLSGTDEPIKYISAYDDFFNLFMDLSGEDSPQKAFESFSSNIVYQTAFSAMLFSDYFVPYFFVYSFNVLQMIADEFEIKLPPIPKKRNYKERFFYYYELNSSLFDFRFENDLSHAELCAFLYDFAPKYVGGTDINMIKDLPEPRGAFFIGGAKNDSFYTESPDAVTPWQCNPDTRVGDLIVFYVKSPVSGICSIWRSVSAGFVDPLFYYYYCSYIGNPVQIKPIGLREIMSDNILGAMPIAKKNFQGINGVELIPSELNHIVELSGADVPKLERCFDETVGEYVSERDVENKLIKPLLKKLGYKDSDYVQQLYIRFGNHNHGLIPDFVLLPRKKGRDMTAFAVLEAKLSIRNDDDLEDAFDQVKSYARILNANICAVASKEKLWILSDINRFKEQLTEVSWEKLKNPNGYKQIERILGKG